MQLWQQRWALESSAEAVLSSAVHSRTTEEARGPRGGPREPRAICGDLQGQLPPPPPPHQPWDAPVPSRRAAGPSVWASASVLSSGTSGPSGQAGTQERHVTAVCALSTIAHFPEFDLRLAALSLAHRVGVHGPVPLCTGWRGEVGCAGLCSPLQVSPLPSHRTCHTSQRASGAHPLRPPGEGSSQGGPGWAELPHQCSPQTSSAEGPPPARCTPRLASQSGVPMG